MELKAVLFDLDGVITDTAKYHFLAWKTCAEKLGFTIDASFNDALKGIDRVQSLRLLLKHGGVTLSETAFARTLETKNRDYLKYIEAMSTEDILPGIQELLNQLQEQNITCILCSASKNAPHILKLLQLENNFQAVVDPTTLEHGKPFPDIFISGAKLAHADVSQCIGIEDAKAGIQAIKEAHMKAIGIGKELLSTQADVVVDSTAELTISLLQHTLQNA